VSNAPDLARNVDMLCCTASTYIEKPSACFEYFKTCVHVPEIFGSQFEFVDSLDVANLKLQNQKMLDHAKDANFMFRVRTR
jgi:hypothetical protein